MISFSSCSPHLLHLRPVAVSLFDVPERGLLTLYNRKKGLAGTRASLKAEGTQFNWSKFFSLLGPPNQPSMPTCDPQPIFFLCWRG